MLYHMIVDTKQQLTQLHNKSVFLYPVLLDTRLHKHNNSIIAFILIDVTTKEVFTVSNTHPEGIFNVNDLEFLNDCNVYCYDTIAFKYAGYDTSKFQDVKMQYYLKTNSQYNQEIPGIVNHYIRLFPTCFKTNELISLYKHEEIAMELFNAIWIKEVQPGLDFYQNDLIESFYNIERHGLKCDLNGFIERFGPSTGRHGSYAYTEYNYYTTTGRPSNRFGGINYAALNKEDGTREVFISRNEKGKLVELDFNSYHPRLIATLIDYDFGTDNAYEHLAKHYANTQTPTPQQIEEAKEMTFRQFYGGIQKQYLHIPFFQKVNDYTKYLWKTMKDNGCIQSPVSGREIYKINHPDLTPAVLFNYFIQMYETECNVIILKSIHKLLQDKLTKPVLYTYDSILFDTLDCELQYLLDTVIPQSIDLIKFPIKIKKGDNYKSLHV